MKRVPALLAAGVALLAAMAPSPAFADDGPPPPPPPWVSLAASPVVADFPEPVQLSGDLDPNSHSATNITLWDGKHNLIGQCFEADHDCDQLTGVDPTDIDIFEMAGGAVSETFEICGPLNCATATATRKWELKPHIENLGVDADGGVEVRITNATPTQWLPKGQNLVIWDVDRDEPANLGYRQCDDGSLCPLRTFVYPTEASTRFQARIIAKRGDHEEKLLAVGNVLQFTPDDRLNAGGPDGVITNLPADFDLCNALLFIPEQPHFDRTTTGDLANTCFAVAAAGVGRMGQWRAVKSRAALYGISAAMLLAWLAHTGSLPELPTIPWPQPAPNPNPGPEPIPLPTPYPDVPPLPAPLPNDERYPDRITLPKPVADDAIEDIAANLYARHAVLGLTLPVARIVARYCVFFMARMAWPIGSCDRAKMPIFVVGYTEPEATDHVFRALLGRPQWAALNYEKSGNKSKVQIPGHGWINSQPECKPKEAGRSCDEFPFYGTEQGGPWAFVRPHLKKIDSTDNTNQGGLYGNFVTACRLKSATLTPTVTAANATGGTRFLVIPIPYFSPTWGLCNGR